MLYVGDDPKVHEEPTVGEEEGAHLHHDEEHHDHDAGGNNENERWTWIHNEVERFVVHNENERWIHER